MAYLGGLENSSPEESEKASAEFLAAFPDIKHTIEDIIAEDDRAVVSIVANGTHKGEWMGFAPTGKEVTYNGIIIFSMEDGRLVAECFYFDGLDLLKQIGLKLEPVK